MPTVDSLHCTAETNNIVKQLYPIKKREKCLLGALDSVILVRANYLL